MGAFLTAWLEGKERNLRPRTHARYGELVRLHALPLLGKRPLAKLGPQDIDGLYAQKLREGLSPATVGQLHRVLHAALRAAVERRLLAYNACDAVRPPRVTRAEMQALGPEEARRLLAAAKGDPFQALYVVAITAGLRQGELFGLKWADVDLDGARLQVRRTLGRVPGRGFVEGEPKSARSRRTVALTPLAVAALREHRVRQLQARLQAGPAWEEQGYVFCNAVGGPLEPGNLRRRSFWPLLERAGLPRMRFHDLRHSAATLMLAGGVHPKIVQEMLGHSSISLTLDTYSHVLPHLQAEAAATMQALLGR